MARQPLRLRLARAILGRQAKEFIPALAPDEGIIFGPSGRINEYRTKPEQLSANVGWCFTANNAIEPFSAINAHRTTRRPGHHAPHQRRTGPAEHPERCRAGPGLRADRSP